MEPTAQSEARQERPPQLLPEHRLMEAFVGHWKSEGRLGPGGEHAPATAEDQYELLPGGFFLVHRGLMHTGAPKPLESLQLLGFDEQARRYRLHLFDNSGYARIYEGVAEGNVWRLAGPKERVTLTFDEGGAKLRTLWEQRQGEQWVPLCELEGTKLH